ncbi:hypothetical protein Tco_1113343 [Tanacetum coccineum]|uniref:Reverse transcriptase domain-containing protein n=1 Tax=Tanacetum coccineum TaxID=301880 RepID=A0ABQ5ITF8_9ASTR
MPKEILVVEEGKFKPPPPMVTPAEKRSSNKFCDFHNDKGHSTDECMQLKKHIEELRMTRQKLTQSFSRGSEITFLPLANSDGTEGPLVIEAEIGGCMIHRMYIDGGDADHSTKAWMNFMIVRSLSPYNVFIGRPGIREIQAVPYMAHGMLKFPANKGIVTIRSTILIPAECTTVITSSKEAPKKAEVRPKNFKIALHPNFPDQEKKRGQAPERSKAIQAEVQKLVETGIMREVYYHDWLSNPVMVKKHDGSWRMFLSKSAEKSLPLFKTLKKCIKKSDFHWTPKAEQAFTQLKQNLSELPLLVLLRYKRKNSIHEERGSSTIVKVRGDNMDDPDIRNTLKDENSS